MKRHSRPREVLLSNSDGRDLTGLERELIQRMVLVLPPETGEGLSRQLDQTSVVVDDLPLALSLLVEQTAEPVDLPDGPIPVATEIWDGNSYQGELIVFVKSGYLTLFEFAWVTDEIPAGFPDPDTVQIKPI